MILKAMKHTITNEFLSVGVLEKGAELASIFDLDSSKEYMWQADDPKYWGRHSSILFPVIGACNEGVVRVGGRSYPMPKHGIVRNAQFELLDTAKDTITFVLRSTESTREHYPFDWRLNVTYKLQKKTLQVEYEVINDDEVSLPYSIGGHPAFNCPLDTSLERSDYSLVFNQNEYQKSPKIDKDGLISKESDTILNHSKSIHITDELFDEDALILTAPKSNKVTLQSDSKRELEFSFNGFSHLGIWSSHRTAPFVCIEPWCGIADPVGYTGDIYSKIGMLELAPKATSKHSHFITIL